MDSTASLVNLSLRWKNFIRTRNPKLYDETREVNEVHFREIFPILEKTLNWKQGGKILDHGSGCGSTAYDFVLPLAKKSNSTIILFDNSQSMIDYAKEKYNDDRIAYLCGEITSIESPLKGTKFDVILSLYTLQLVDDYKKELIALHDHLADDGELFMIIVLHAPYFELFEKLQQDEKWKEPAMIHLVVPEWSMKTENEDECLKNAFEKAGFETISYKREERTHQYKNWRGWSDFAFSLNSFAKHFPEEDCENLRELYYDFFKKQETKTHKPGDASEDSPYILHYEVVIIHAKRRQI